MKISSSQLPSKSSQLFSSRSLPVPSQSSPVPSQSSPVPLHNISHSTINIDCTVNGNIYKCSNPENLDNTIIITDGPIFKISYSTEINTFGETTIDYYIIVPFVFIIDYIISVNTKEIVINSLNDFIKSLDIVNQQYINTNNIPDKCLNVPLKIRNDSKPPYNTTCIFFDNGFGKLSAISNTIEKSLLPGIPDNVLNDYFNLISDKIKTTSTLTVFEYVMYMSLLNKLKNKNNKYLTLCISDDLNTIC